MNFWRLTILAVAAGCICLFGVIIYLPFLNDFQNSGQISVSGLESKTSITRDEKGMAYVRAENFDDLLIAQGFATAQDRLFQMQLTRMVAQGRISELAGQKGRNMDIRMRTVGLHRMAKKQAAILNPATAGQFQKYVAGINAFIDTCPDDIPLEFRLAGISPEKWDITDSLSIAYYMGWATSANMNSEIIAQMLLDTVGYQKFLEILPLNFNPDDPSDTGEIWIPEKKQLATTFPGIEKLLAFRKNEQLRAGSNNWALSGRHCMTKGPILCGDPHMEARFLPGPWYPIGLIAPGIRAVGAHIPGLPGMVIGRTSRIALAMTNNYGDMQDLYIEKIDPENPDHYMEGVQSLPFDRRTETLKIKDKTAADGFVTETVTIRSTRRGPVITDLFPGISATTPVTLRFAPAWSMTQDIGLLDILTAKNSRELDNALKKIPMICLNWVFADIDGNIGYRASGKIPVRKNQTGALPLPVTDGLDNWKGWIPQNQMPSSQNPPENWLGTCNHKTIRADFPYYYSSFFAGSFRYRRLKELMDKQDKKSLDDLWQFQRDPTNLLARSAAPVLAGTLLKHEDTRIPARLLLDWDFKDDPDKAAPCIFQAVFRLLAQKVFEDELGEAKADLMLNNWYFWQERLLQMVLDGTSPWFDDIRTPDKKETLEDLIHQAGMDAVLFLSEKMGKHPEKWKWGKVHTLELFNPLVPKGPAGSLFSTGTLPMGGSGETLYRGLYKFSKPFNVSYCATLRMAADLSDPDKIAATLPGGGSSRIFHPHIKDQTNAFMSGQKLYWWFSDKAIDRHAESVLVLLP